MQQRSKTRKAVGGGAYSRYAAAYRRSFLRCDNKRRLALIRWIVGLVLLLIVIYFIVVNWKLLKTPDPADVLEFGLPLLLVFGLAYYLELWRRGRIGGRISIRLAIWIASGMVAGFCVSLFILGSRYRVPHEPNPIVALSLVGALLGFVAAKVFRVK